MTRDPRRFYPCADENHVPEDSRPDAAGAATDRTRDQIERDHRQACESGKCWCGIPGCWWVAS